MARYIIKRLMIAVPSLLGITLLNYLLMNLTQGTPLSLMIGPRTSQAAVALRMQQLGLDQPIYIQYFSWLKELLHGNLGYSITAKQPVADLIGSHIAPSLLLMVTSLLIGLLIAIPIGVYSATHQYSAGDYTAMSLSFLGTSIPNFFFALLLVYVFTVRLGWLPSSGMYELGTNGGTMDLLKHMVMPVTVLSLFTAGVNVRYIRSAMLEILQQDYLRTAKAKGVKPFWIINRHALRNALLPVITIIGLQIPFLFGGSVVVEQIFSWPGLGLLTMTAITSRDYPTIMGISLLSGLIVLSCNLFVDIIYAVVDPTIEYK